MNSGTYPWELARHIGARRLPLLDLKPLAKRNLAMNIAKVVFAFGIAVTLTSTAALAVDTVQSKEAPDLTAVRAKIKGKDFAGALADLNKLADTYQHADVYNLIGFSLRKTGDYARALTFYRKALDFDANHKGAHEYLGELYVETAQLPKAREHLAILVKLCPQGCEEREDLEKAIVTTTAPKTN